MLLKWRSTSRNGVLNAPKRQGDAGLDLVSAEQVYLTPTKMSLVHTGISVAIPDGYVGIIKERSSMAWNGLKITGGVIDSGYRGEIMAICSYQQPNEFAPFVLVIEKGERFAQLLIIKIAEGITLEKVDNLEATERGDGGFGSTNN